MAPNNGYALCIAAAAILSALTTLALRGYPRGNPPAPASIEQAPPAAVVLQAGAAPTAAAVQNLQNWVSPESPAEDHGQTPVTEDEAAPSELGIGEIAANMDWNFSNDGPATTESHRLAGALRSALEDVSLRGVHVRGVECRANTCRAEITFADGEAGKVALNQVLANPTTSVAPHLGSLVPKYDYNADGTVSATIYIYSHETNPHVQAKH